MSEPILEVQRLVRHFGAVRAVDDISFEVRRGQVFGFIGPNGAGKTTTMRIIATLDIPEDGDVRVAGVSVVEDAEQVHRLIGFMPDYTGLYANTTVIEYLDFFARAHKLTGDARRRAVDGIVDFMGLGELRDRPVDKLSKGLKQRVSLGRALVHDPQILILDEPASGLDPRARIELRTLIRELAADGKTIFLSSHILTELSEICDAVAVIERGKLLATGSVEKILKNLRQHRVLSVRVASRREDVERFLLEQPGVLRTREHNGSLEFDFTGDDNEQMALLARLVAAGYPVLEFNVRGADLEDLFLKITQGAVQ